MKITSSLLRISENVGLALTIGFVHSNDNFSNLLRNSPSFESSRVVNSSTKIPYALTSIFSAFTEYGPFKYDAPKSRR